MIRGRAERPSGACLPNLRRPATPHARLHWTAPPQMPQASPFLHEVDTWARLLLTSWCIGFPTRFPWVSLTRTPPLHALHYSADFTLHEVEKAVYDELVRTEERSEL